MPLSRGLTAFVDARDGHVLDIRWHACQTGRKRLLFYATGRIGGQRVLLHRLVAGAGTGDVVDHINGDASDNRRSNLRVGSQADNMRNRRHEAGVGTSYDRQTCKRAAKHVWRGRQFFLGHFRSKEEATAAVLASVAEKRAAQFAVADRVLA